MPFLLAGLTMLALYQAKSPPVQGRPQRPAAARGLSLPSLDFSDPHVVAHWHEVHDLNRPEATPEGMALEITGDDPYAVSDAPLELPSATPLWARIRIKAEQPGFGQLF